MHVENSPVVFTFDEHNHHDSLMKMNADVCDQCGMCLSACSVASRIDGFNSLQIIAKVCSGKEWELIRSGVIWAVFLLG